MWRQAPSNFVALRLNGGLEECHGRYETRGVEPIGGGELGVQRVRQARDDFVLHVEKIGQGLIEPLGPEMIARFGVDELHIDAHSVSAALNAALQHIADVQVASDCLHVEPLALVNKRRIAGDHDRASNA